MLTKGKKFIIYQEAEEVDPMGIPVGESDVPPDYSNLQEHLPDALLSIYRNVNAGVLATEEKFNPYHDPHTGRFESGGIGEAALAVQEHGGFTMRNHAHSGITHGMALSPYPERSVVISGMPSKEDVRSFLRKNKDVLDQPNHYMGGWFDSESKKTFLDVSIVVQDAKQAVALSKKYKQRAYYDLDKGEEVRVLSESEAHQVG